MEERNALVFSRKSDWMTTLYASFQDEENLYLVMEYVSGASFRALMNNRETIMTEDEAKFYVAEMTLALEELHRHGYIHRDIKPENYLVDASGHIKLADFGSCIRFTKDKMISSQITVGTPDYISPEILRANEGKAEYSVEVDWWSLGIIIYELLYDEVPFYSESLVGTYGKIMNHEKTFSFPDEPELSSDCKNLISKFICRSEIRLGKESVDNIKRHPWFQSVDWQKIRKSIDFVV
jgi:serine/threonine protein kinase